MIFNKISIIGLGYIGLPTAAIFANKEIKVVGVDISQKIVDTINSGDIHISEPALKELVKKTVQLGFLRASLEVEPSDVFIITVPTPFKQNHEPDLTSIVAAIKSIAPVLKSGDLVILESTSPVGTTEEMSQLLSELRQDLSFPHKKKGLSEIRIAHCPERVLPGDALRELVENDRIIGGVSDACSQSAAVLYKQISIGTLHLTTSRTAEMSKLAENSFRDVNIAFANELSMICDDLDINVRELIKLTNCHPRVEILNPGVGVGGHCIAVDPWFIVNKTPGKANLIKVARETNDKKPVWVVNKIKTILSDYIAENSINKQSDVTIACLGLTFKANVDDLRQSPALQVVLDLVNQVSSNFLIVEPNISVLPTELQMESVKLLSVDEALIKADIIIALVGHNEFKSVMPDLIQGKIYLDICGIKNDC